MANALPPALLEPRIGTVNLRLMDSFFYAATEFNRNFVAQVAQLRDSFQRFYTRKQRTIRRLGFPALWTASSLSGLRDSGPARRSSFISGSLHVQVRQEKQKAPMLQMQGKYEGCQEDQRAGGFLAKLS